MNAWIYNLMPFSVHISSIIDVTRCCCCCCCRTKCRWCQNTFDSIRFGSTKKNPKRQTKFNSIAILTWTFTVNTSCICISIMIIFQCDSGAKWSHWLRNQCKHLLTPYYKNKIVIMLCAHNANQHSTISNALNPIFHFN